MFYGNNGNILSKTGLGSYEYNNTSKPHAVTAVDNTDDMLAVYEQEVEYNLWGKVSDVWHDDGWNYYHYHIDYGPDLQRVRSILYNGNQFEYEKFYWGDYEEKRTLSETGMYWYVNTPDGLSGFYYKEDSQNGTWTDVVAAMTDHLGSITCLMDDFDYCYDASYDPWGYRDLDMDFYQPFDRGFCGHEHIDALGLIDMNGRMYDYNLGRFLSPDNYIQSPGNPQNYNRYSYCLNNPLKYTDPDGESIAVLATVGLFAYGMINLIIQADNNNIHSPGDALNALIGGAAAGLSEASSWAIGFAGIASGTPLGVLLGMGIMSGKSWNLTTTATSLLFNPKNAAKIFFGRYYTDENGNAWDQAKQGLSRFLWEGPQTWAGYNWSQVRNIIGDVDVVDYLGGATFCINENGSFGSVSLGNYINADLSGQYEGSIIKHPVLMHEYGHTFDSRKYGPAYLFEIGIPSMKSAKNSNKTNGYNHSWYWTELRANNSAKKYFGRYYGVDWSPYEEDISSSDYYPVVKPRQDVINNYINQLKKK